MTRRTHTGRRLAIVACAEDASRGVVEPSPGSRTASATLCPYCSLQCGIELVGEPPESLPLPDFPTNGGGLCIKGWTAGELLGHPDRLTTPLVRAGGDGPLRPASWDEALDLVAGRLAATRTDHGPDAVGVFGGGGLTNEKSYLLGKFARVALRTRHIDYNGRFCMSSAATAGLRALGLDRGLPFPAADIGGAGAVLLAGSNLAETMPPVMRHFDEQRRRGGELIVLDARATPTAAAATLHLRPQPGTDLAVAHGLLNRLVALGAVDHDYIASRTVGFDEARRVAASYWPDRVERLTGVPATALEDAARRLAAAPTVMVLTGRGVEQHASGTDTVLAFINLALALGQVGRPFGGYGCVTGQGNGQGGREHGQKADQLPGYRSIENPEHRAQVAAVWGVAPESLPGKGVSAVELLAGAGTEGGIRALLVMGSNPAVCAPDAGAVRRQLAALDMLVVADCFLSETAAGADVVLPVTQWAEEDGTVTNFEGRVLRRRRVVPRPPGVRSDLDVIVGLAARLGAGDRFPSAAPAAVFAEFRRATAGGPADYSGITWERIDEHQGIFWPCPAADHPGTPRLFADGDFPTPDGRARFSAVELRSMPEAVTDEYPFTLTTGRVTGQYNSGTQTRRAPSLARAEPEAFVELNPMVARRLGVDDGEAVTVSSRRGRAVLRVRLTSDLRPDLLFVPFHWGGSSSVNRLTDPTLDPRSRMPAFKACAARIDPLPTDERPGRPTERT